MIISRTKGGLVTQKLGDWLGEKPFTLALSSSFFGFFAHAGATAALESAGLRPEKVGGASAGALVAGAMGSGLTANETRELFYSIRREDFWDPGLGFGLLRGRFFQRLLEKHLVQDFAAAKIPFEVSAFDLRQARTRFLNSGHVASAVLASCAVPGLFHPVVREKRILVDGGVLNKSGLNPNDRRAVSLYFQSPGKWGDWEQRLNSRRLTNEQKLVVYKNLPSVSFTRLDLGPEAFEQAYRRTKIALGLPVGSDA